jgi:hypothetical protein
VNTLSSITKPLTASGYIIGSEEICKIIDSMANIPYKFKARDLRTKIFGIVDWDITVCDRICDRLLQRWKKSGLVEYRSGMWHMTRHQWDIFQRAVSWERLGDRE